MVIYTGGILCSHPPFLSKEMPMYQTVEARFVVAVHHPGYCYPEVLGMFFSPHKAFAFYQDAKAAYPKSEVLLGMR